ncbi:Gfo/Idh/MocA family oxidoreductase (plasmid) [Rhizobium sp. RCAM05350]|nr:Gfo/Idh/MocA family oxidoreductase [Rhizobium sp. RCAM05350]
MKRYKVVIIGAGRIADVHALSIARNPTLELVGLVDPLGGGALREKWSVPNFEKLQDAIYACKPDALVIASPTQTHVPYLIEACRFGLPTLCEKPVAFTREPIIEAISAVNAANIPVVLGFHRRFDAYRQEVHASARGPLAGWNTSSNSAEIPALPRDPRFCIRVASLPIWWFTTLMSSIG